MHSANELDRDIPMSYHNTHGKKSRIHEKTYFLARNRTAVNQCTVSRLRLLKFLPPRETSEEKVLQIPDSITTEAELFTYVKQHRRHWLRGSGR